MNVLRLSLLQIPLVWQAPAENRKEIEKLLFTTDKKSDLIFLPEMFSSGFTMQPELVAETMEGPTVQWMLAMAQKM
ncbi:nitrilase family protein, partial [Flavobacteriaceae bacterium]|nr:nitrilase family protein [Flavobacteriaceae bacterium]